jgi:hypothetical protein
VLASRISAGQLNSLRALSPDCHPAIADLMDCLLAPDPERRPGDATVWARRVRQVIEEVGSN